MKNRLWLLIFGFFTLNLWGVNPSEDSIYYVGLTPGKPLKTPGMILGEIDDFFKKDGNQSLIPDRLREADAKVRISTAQMLLHNAYFAENLCAVYLNDPYLNKSEAKQYLRTLRSWSRDRMRFNEFQKSHSGLDRDQLDKAYVKYLDEEKARIIEDCQQCRFYKKKFDEATDHLVNFIMYHKQNAGVDPLGEQRYKLQQEYAAETRKLNEAFAGLRRLHGLEG